MPTDTFATSATRFVRNPATVTGASGPSIQIDGDGPVSTLVVGVDAAGEAYGVYAENGQSPNSVSHAFVVRNGVLVTLDFPAGQYVNVFGVDASGNPFGSFGSFSAAQSSSGFVSPGGVITPISGPNGAPTIALGGVDAAGDIVGTYYDSQYHQQIFIDQDGTSSSVPVGSFATASVVGVAADGTIFGNASNQAFLDKNGTVTVLPAPANEPTGTQVQISGVDAAGDYLGEASYFSSTPYYINYLQYFTGKDGSASALGINYGNVASAQIDGAGDIVGTYVPSSTQTLRGYVDHAGVYTTFDIPASLQTNFTPLGLDPAGDVIGSTSGANFEEAGVSLDIATGVVTTLAAKGSVTPSFTQIYTNGLAFATYSDANGGGALLDRGGKLTTVAGPAGAQRFTFAGADAAGDVFGTYFDTRNKSFGFELSGGTLATINGPSGATNFSISGVDAAGDYAGTYSSGGTTFAYVTTASGLAPLSGPPASQTVPSTGMGPPPGPGRGSQSIAVTGMDAAGDVLGTYQDSDGNQSGFVYRAGVYTTASAPSDTFSESLSLVGMDTAGDIVGNTSSFGPNGTIQQGFVQAAGAAGSTTFVGPSGATQTMITGINASGEIVGSYVDANGVTHGFRDNAGTFTTVDGPGATATQVTAVDDNGDLAGSFVDASGATHAFLNGAVVVSQPAAVSFDAAATVGATSGGSTAVTLTGTVSGFGAIVDVYDGTTLLGQATIGNDGTWVLNAALAAGTHADINAAETDDTPGATARATAPYSLNLGITGEPYTSVDTTVTNGVVTGQTYVNADGSPYVAATYGSDGVGGTQTTFSGGSFFNGLPYASYTTDTNASGALDKVTQFNADGSTYFAYTITPDASGGGSTYDYTGGSALDGRNYTAYTEHFDGSGALTERTLQNVSGGSYSNVEQDVSNGVIVREVFSGFPSDSNYDSFAYQFDSAGNLQSQSNTYKDGTHQSQGFRDGVTLTALGNDTLTGAGQSDTFVFNPGFGQAVVTDFYQHLDGTTHDTISVSSSEFADFATLLADTSNVGGSAVITGQNGDAITLLGVTKDQIAANQNDFVFRLA